MNRTAWKTLLLVAAAVAAYLPALNAGFIWDDDPYVTENLTLRSLEGLRRIWFEIGAVPQYYPLVHTTFWIEWQLFGNDPTGYHVVNVALHVANALLLWRILARLRVPGAWLAGVLFAVHPVHVESVAWITERKNVLSTLFALAATLVWLRFEEDEETGRRRWCFYGLASLLFVCALLSKTVVCTLPAALVVVSWWRRSRLTARHALPMLPWLVFGAFMAWVTVWVETHVVGTEHMEWGLGPVERCLIAGRVFWFYPAKLLWPHPLIFFYPRWHIDAGAVWQYLYPAAALGVLVLLWLLRARITKGPLAALLVYGILVAPALGFVLPYPMRFSFVADHFQYLGSIGILALVAALADRVFRRAAAMARTGAALVAIVVLGTLTWRQGHMYADVETLWSTTIERNPAAWLARYNLGTIYMQADRVDEALEQFEEALRHEQGYSRIPFNYGVALSRLGRDEEAETQYRRALEASAGNYPARYNLALLLAERGAFEEALEQYEVFLTLRPDHLGALENIGVLLVRLQRFDPAIAHFQRMVQNLPDEPTAHFRLGWALSKAGFRKRAIARLNETLALRPDHAAARRLLEELTP